MLLITTILSAIAFFSDSLFALYNIKHMRQSILWVVFVIEIGLVIANIACALLLLNN